MTNLHFIASISPTNKMLFHTELLLHSLERNGLKKYDFTLVVSGDTALVEEYPYVKKRAEIIRTVPYTEDNFAAGQLRWELQPRTERCILIDVDILSIKPFFEDPAIFEDAVCGVIGYENPFSMGSLGVVNSWEALYKACSCEMKDRFQHYVYANELWKYSPIYFNIGFVSCPVNIYKELGAARKEILPKLKKMGHHYHLSQMALGVAISQTKVPYSVLPLRYNFPDIKGLNHMHKTEFQKIVNYHILHTKERLKDWNDLRHANDPLIDSLKQKNVKFI